MVHNSPPMSELKISEGGPAQNSGSPAATLESLSTRFEVFRKGLPLSIGIHHVIRERMPEIQRSQLVAALKRHTSSTRYLKALSQGTERFDLDGNPSGTITQEQRDQASTMLKERFKRVAEKRRAEQQEKEHQEKLQQLAQKFNTRA